MFGLFSWPSLPGSSEGTEGHEAIKWLTYDDGPQSRGARLIIIVLSSILGLASRSFDLLLYDLLALNFGLFCRPGMSEHLSFDSVSQYLSAYLLELLGNHRHISKNPYGKS